jgi:hypothetical protein
MFIAILNPSFVSMFIYKKHKFADEGAVELHCSISYSAKLMTNGDAALHKDISLNMNNDEKYLNNIYRF